MTGTANSDHQQLNPGDVEGIYDMLNYAGNGGSLAKKFGPEAEFFACRIDNDGDVSPLTAEQADALQAELYRRCGKLLSREAIHDHVELDFHPLSLRDFDNGIHGCQKLIESLFYAAQACGLRIIPANHPPHIPQVNREQGVDGILKNLDSRPRIQFIMNAGIDIFGEEVVNFANGAAAIHVSSSYADPRELYDDLRRANYLAPLDMAVTSCCFPFNDGMQDRRGRNHRLDAINAFGATRNGRTGIDPLFYTARDGEDFLKQYVERVLHSPMLGYYPDTQGDERPITELGASAQKPLRFMDLPEECQTVSNFKLAASCFWYHTKIADLPLAAENGRPHKRLERRVYNSGPWQLAASTLEAALIGSDSNCAEDIDQLLEKFGYHRDGPANHPESGDLLKQAMERAQEVGASKGLDFQFGREPEQTAQAFEKQRVQILKKYAGKYEREYDMSGLTDLLAPREYIAENNRPDTLVLSEICRTADDVAAFIRDYDANMLLAPNMTLGMMQRRQQLPVTPSQKKPGIGPSRREIAHSPRLQAG